MFKALLLINLLYAIGDASRHRRYLVYPDGGPARAQFIIGLGVPVDLKEASVTVGTVIKFQYDLPTNSTEYTSRIYGFADTVSRDMDDEAPKDGEDNIDVIDSRGINNIENDLDDYNNTLVDITFNERRRRALLYAEGNAIVEDNTSQLPLDEAIRRQELIDQKAREAQEPQRMNRWDFYKILEHMVERYGFSGRPCLLRTICEAAEVPFTYENGLLGEIGHILFTPSSTKDELSHHTDNEYHAAERVGREAVLSGSSCESVFPECESSVLETFTEIGMNTLQKFGLNG
ncbi:uncharacterized protein LOC126967582 [Leptidea sinapis]|uniref:uncharacterized protein LOC126967582 n=1 Tax=Leptidea sinapis TaxID=189913 RepID=UPI00211F50E6|nr:uncharacterized protein LOC126967582 [Leptidea sinapis]